jgi:peptidoglycan hydrolase-like protein with peptidoglycan-binding domain
MRRFILAIACVALASAAVVLVPGSAQAVTPNCISDSMYQVATASDGDPIMVFLPNGGGGVNGTVCLLAKQRFYNPGVYDVQSALHYCYGYSLALDGIFGNGTYTAVRDFQSKHNLTVDGVYGPNTAKKLFRDSFYGELSRHHVPGAVAGCRSAASQIK